MTDARGYRPTKRAFSGVPVSNDKQITEWLEGDEEAEFSDVDAGDDPEHEVEEKQLAEVIQSEEEIDEDERSEDTDSTDDEENLTLAEITNLQKGRDAAKYIGKNGFIWSQSEIGRTSRTPAHNIIPVSRPSEPHVFRGFYYIWSKIFDTEMVRTIVTNTNQKLGLYREKFHNTNRQELKDTDESEIRSLFGLLYYSSVFKCNDADATYLFATDGTGHEIFRCVMSKYRFCTLLNCLRVDNGADRQERLQTDALAAVSWIFGKFITNSQQNFVPGPNICIDEMLIPFRGRCKFIIYMPKKPAKYGIKMVILCDAEKYYVYNAYIYSGRNSDGEGLSEEERKLGVPTQSVLRLVKPIENTNRNITADNWFSSVPLMEILRSKKLTYLGTLKKNKREIPPEFQPNKRREPNSSLYGFTKVYTLLSHVPKRNKAVILISSSHHVKSTDEETNKPTMIVDYNRHKGGVDEIDKKCSIYSCSRKTRRWPMALFYRILDLAGVNAYALYNECPGTKLRRGDFLLSLARELVLPKLKERVYNDRLPRELRLTIKRVLANDLPQPPQPEPPPEPIKRKLCYVCPSRLKRQTRFTCCACKKSICLQCSGQICEDCKLQLVD